MAAVIIAVSWAANEVVTIEKQVDLLFHFAMDPNGFSGFDESNQIALNKYVEGILND